MKKSMLIINVKNLHLNLLKKMHVGFTLMSDSTLRVFCSFPQLSKERTRNV